MNKVKVPNNQDSVSKKVNALKLKGVRAVGDDGNVIVEVKGNLKRLDNVVKILESKFRNLSVGDGVQEGEIWINADEVNVHESLYDLFYKIN